MKTYTVNGMTEREVKRLGENRWFYQRKWVLLFQMLIPIVIALIMVEVLSNPYKPISLIPVLVFLYFYWAWISKSGKAGKELLKSLKEAK